MANSLGAWNATLFAQEALIRLEKSIGFAARVHRGYEAERAAANVRGDVVSIPRPGRFAAADHVVGTGTAKQDVDAGTVQVALDRHKEVKFAVSDRELAYAGPRFIDDHLNPAVDALAQAIDEDLAALSLQVPWVYDLDATPAAEWITGPRQILRDNGAPMTEGYVHYGVDPTVETGFLGMTLFHSAETVGGVTNQETLMRGSLGTRFGAEIFVDQNMPRHSGGTVVVNGTDVAGTLAADAVKGATTIDVDGLSGSETLKAGDSFGIAGDSQRYVVTEDATAALGAITGLKIAPSIVTNYTTGDAVTFEDGSGAAVHADDSHTNVFFHRNAFALVVAPLPDTGDGRGAQITTITDPKSALSVRARLFYDGDTATNLIALDVLYGLTVLDPNLAVRVRRDV
ncbi:MAG: hypothetical protein NXI16_09295 [Alphaproteobacteria bacterium]|nr:hypothetical protein [Alphaproteobacteria bacterium]